MLLFKLLFHIVAKICCKYTKYAKLQGHLFILFLLASFCSTCNLCPTTKHFYLEGCGVLQDILAPVLKELWRLAWNAIRLQSAEMVTVVVNASILKKKRLTDRSTKFRYLNEGQNHDYQTLLSIIT